MVGWFHRRSLSVYPRCCPPSWRRTGSTLTQSSPVSRHYATERSSSLVLTEGKPRLPIFTSLTLSSEVIITVIAGGAVNLRCWRHDSSLHTLTPRVQRRGCCVCRHFVLARPTSWVRHQFRAALRAVSRVVPFAWLLLGRRVPGAVSSGAVHAAAAAAAHVIHLHHGGGGVRCSAAAAATEAPRHPVHRAHLRIVIHLHRGGAGGGVLLLRQCCHRAGPAR